MEIPLLSEKEILPTNEVIEKALGERYFVFKEFIEIITNSKFGLVLEWKYYNDGKSWLCKVCYKKKTVFWLSIWNNFFKVGFYFTEKNCLEIASLDIDNKTKEEFSHSKNIGKLIPLTIKMIKKEQIDDVLKIIEYKKKLK